MPDKPPSQVDDEELAIRLMDRDEEALRVFIEIHVPTAKWVLKSNYGSVLSAEEIDAALNLALLNLWHAVERFDKKKGSLRALFVTIAQNAAVDIVRGELDRWEHERFFQDGEDPPWEQPETDATPSEPSAEQARLTKDLGEVLTSLRPLERKIADADALAGGEAETERLVKEFGSTKGAIWAARSSGRKKIREGMRLRGHFRDDQRSAP